MDGAPSAQGAAAGRLLCSHGPGLLHPEPPRTGLRPWRWSGAQRRPARSRAAQLLTRCDWGRGALCSRPRWRWFAGAYLALSPPRGPSMCHDAPTSVVPRILRSARAMRVQQRRCSWFSTDGTYAFSACFRQSTHAALTHVFLGRRCRWLTVRASRTPASRRCCTGW